MLMKKLLLILVLAVVFQTTFSQFIYKIKADSLLVTNDSCTAELNLENSTKNIKGFLYNKGNGRTEFRKAVIVNDSSFVLGSDTLVIKGASSWRLAGNSGTNPATNFLGTTDNQPLLLKTNNAERLRVGSTGFVGINNNNPTTWLHIVDTTERVHAVVNATTKGNGFMCYQLTNSSTGSGAGAGAAYWNNANELMQLYMGGTNNGFTPSMALLRSSGVRGMKIAADNDAIRFQIGTVTPTGLADSGNIKVMIDSFGMRIRKIDPVLFDSSNYQAVVIDKLNGRLYKANSAGIGAGSGWLLTGNAGTNPATNFLGTTDNQPLLLKTNNAERVRVATSGKVGINTANPLYKLDARGSTDSSYTMIHISRDTTDTGGYIGISQHPVMLLSADATANSYNGNWIAKGTAAAMMSIAAGNNANPNVAFFFNTGLTPGTSFSPWNLMQLNGGTAYGSMRGVGIGEPVSWHRLHVTSSDSNVLGILNNGALSATSGAMLRMYNTGTPGAADQRLGALAWGTGGGLNAMRTGARIQCFSEAAWTDNASQPAYLTVETTPAGANTPSERMRITSAGNVGIGTTAPDKKLQVAGQGLFSDTLTAQRTVSVTGNINVTQGAINMTTTGIAPHIVINANQDGWPRIVINNSANTASAGAGVFFTNNAGQFLQQYIGSSANAFVPGGALIRSSGSGGMAIVADSGVIAFGKDAHIGVSEFARFLTNGNLGVGTLTPAYKVDVNGKLAVRTVDSTATAPNVLYQDAATGEIKKAAVAPYKKYVAIISQTGTNNPTVTVLENTLGNIVWTRQGAGDYTGTLSNAFPANKTFIVHGDDNEFSGGAFKLNIFRDGSSTIRMESHALNESLVDELVEVSVEIRVYP
jgi:hypothetical protein